MCVTSITFKLRKSMCSLVPLLFDPEHLSMFLDKLTASYANELHRHLKFPHQLIVPNTFRVICFYSGWLRAGFPLHGYPITIIIMTLRNDFNHLQSPVWLSYIVLAHTNPIFIHILPTKCPNDWSRLILFSLSSLSHRPPASGGEISTHSVNFPNGSCDLRNGRSGR